MRNRLAFLVAASATFSLGAQAPADDVLIGVGSETCVTFMASGKAEGVYIAWAQGYLSGANAARHGPSQSDLLPLPARPDLAADLTSYCSKNLLTPLSKAVSVVWQQVEEVQAAWRKEKLLFLQRARDEGFDYLASSSRFTEFNTLLKTFAAEAQQRGMGDDGAKLVASKWAMEQAHAVMKLRYKRIP